MQKMLRSQNPGLRRRFNPENALIFKDYDDVALYKIISLVCQREKLNVAYAVKKFAVKILAKERCKPNFGNAGAVNMLLGRAKVGCVLTSYSNEKITSNALSVDTHIYLNTIVTIGIILHDL